MRFFPRYYFQVLPIVVLLAARGFAQLKGSRLLALLLLIPLARFAPTYFEAARNAAHGKVPYRQRAKHYAQKRKTYLLQSPS